MTGKELAQKVRTRYGTTDVLAIAKQLGITVIYQKWYPSTVGEFNRKTKTIHINLNANIETEQILVHELGHYFLNEMNNAYTREEEERIVSDFVKEWVN